LIKVTAQLRIDLLLLIKLEQTFHHIVFAFLSSFFTFKRLCKAMKVGCGCDFKQKRCGLFSWNRKIKTKCVRCMRREAPLKDCSFHPIVCLYSSRIASLPNRRNNKLVDCLECFTFFLFCLFATRLRLASRSLLPSLMRKPENGTLDDVGCHGDRIPLGRFNVSSPAVSPTLFQSYYCGQNIFKKSLLLLAYFRFIFKFSSCYWPTSSQR
jgi:hypothetical protein